MMWTRFKDHPFWRPPHQAAATQTDIERALAHQGFSTPSPSVFPPRLTRVWGCSTTPLARAGALHRGSLQSTLPEQAVCPDTGQFLGRRWAGLGGVRHRKWVAALPLLFTPKRRRLLLAGQSSGWLPIARLCCFEQHRSCGAHSDIHAFTFSCDRVDVHKRADHGRLVWPCMDLIDRTCEYEPG